SATRAGRPRHVVRLGPRSAPLSRRRLLAGRADRQGARRGRGAGRRGHLAQRRAPGAGPARRAAPPRAADETRFGPGAARSDRGARSLNARVLTMDRMAQEDVRRTSPDVFLKLIEKSRRGKLKIYIGHAAGVGKTYQMLEDAHNLKKQGVDVVIGFIETHGRAETAEKIGDLEVVPRRRTEYKGRTLEEMDLPAILARKPEGVIVDELAHTNVPGTEHPKR